MSFFADFWVFVESITREPEPVEVEPGIVYRYTVGTNFSDRAKPVSFTGYFFKLGEFEQHEEHTCFLLFFEEAFKMLYPKKNYDYNDFLVGWDTKIREEHNAPTEEPESADGEYDIEYKKNERLVDTKSGRWKI